MPQAHHSTLRRRTFNPTHTLSSKHQNAQRHRWTDGQTDRRKYHANCMQQYKRLKTQTIPTNTTQINYTVFHKIGTPLFSLYRVTQQQACPGFNSATTSVGKYTPI